MYRLRHSTGPIVCIAVAAAMSSCTSGSEAIPVPGADDIVTAPVATLDVEDVEQTPVEGDTDTPTATLPPLTPDAATNSGSTTVPASTGSTSTVPPSTVPPTTAPPAAAPPADDGFLRIGDQGDDVSLMQLKLGALGYLPQNAESGVFDRATADGLIDFQAQYGLVVDGIFGPETDRALTAAAQSVNPEG